MLCFNYQTESNIFLESIYSLGEKRWIFALHANLGSLKYVFSS